MTVRECQGQGMTGVWAGRAGYDHSNDAETHDAGCQGDNQSGQDILPEHPYGIIFPNVLSCTFYPDFRFQISETL